MTTADTIADRVIGFLGRRTMLTTGTREELRKMLADEFSAVAPRQQPSLCFEDEKAALKGQSEAILRLLKQRRSSGAMNWELAEISLKYTSRISDLRAAGWKITCQIEAGRTRRYVLSATDW